jgi:hypothetical protein
LCCENTSHANDDQLVATVLVDLTYQLIALGLSWFSTDASRNMFDVIFFVNIFALFGEVGYNDSLYVVLEAKIYELFQLLSWLVYRHFDHDRFVDVQSSDCSE